LQNVNYLTIFVENNQGGEATSALNRIVLIGSTASFTDMSRFGGGAGGTSSATNKQPEKE
jgi:hypothetical protein